MSESDVARNAWEVIKRMKGRVGEMTEKVRGKTSDKRL